MQVPYADKWRSVINSLRKIALACGLDEETKWGKPCYTLQKKNVVIIIPLKDACALSFFKGALLKGSQRILQRIGAHTQGGRWIKFTSVKEVAALRGTLKHCIEEAVQIEKAGKKVRRRKESDYEIPGELQTRLKATPALQAAFDALTPGRRKSYLIHIAGAKQAKTRVARVGKCVPMIMDGRGFNERPK